MRILALSDPHLSAVHPKPMDVFGQNWRDHPARIAENWRRVVRDDDVVLVPGDISWAMRLEEAAPDLAMRRSEVPADAVTSGRVLLVDCHDTEASTQAARLARAAGIRTVVDVERVRPGIGDLLQQIDVIIAAADFPTELTGEPTGAALATMAREFRAPLICVTLGEDGSLGPRASGRDGYPARRARGDRPVVLDRYYAEQAALEDRLRS